MALLAFRAELHPNGAKNAEDSNKFPFTSLNKLWFPPRYFS
jgi:hypothetical protein